MRIDVSEYPEKHSVSRLVGAPPGYVGYDEGGQLTEAVRRRPYSVVLLDEVENAHPGVFELLNRLDEVVMFDALTRDDLAHIVDLQLALLEKRLAARRIDIDVTDAAREWLADTGYDPAYGARPLRRLIQSAIGDPLARMLLAGQVVDGSTVRVDHGTGDGAAGAHEADGLTLTVA